MAFAANEGEGTFLSVLCEDPSAQLQHRNPGYNPDMLPQSSSYLYP